ncbi:uncharacterized protein [Palaemon carinicauda]|uniref:uncharacterized protein isoform X2 n=1 Tax=Palaemon carinicauda TaxID=392227 RepID=UPI0035B5ACEA
MVVTTNSFHPSGYLFSAPSELPPSYEESLSPSHQLNLHANMATGHTHLHEASFDQPDANNPSGYGNAAYFINTNSKPGGFVGEGKKIGEDVPIEVLSAGGTHPGFHPAVVGPGVPPSPTAASRLPVRPAPSPPVNVPSAPSATLEQQPHWWTTLREGEAPPDCVISWKGAKGLKIYFIQEEGHIVSPTKPLEMIVFKKIRSETGMLDEGSLGCEAKSGIVEDSLLGMIEVMGSWRLRLHGNNSFCLHTYNDVYVFLDDSTCPKRIVILELPHDVSKTMRSDLHALLQEMTDLREEQEGVVGKITTNVGTVYDDITKKINLAVKDVAPGAHKSTKWIRKGTGSLVRLGGNLVSKGLHIVADHIPATQPEQQEEESPLHSVLLEGLKKFQKDLESKTITYV